MYTDRFTRRNLVIGLAAIPSALGITVADLKAADNPAAANAAADAEISRTAVAIHQEILLPASRPRLYRTLTDSRAFDRVVRLSDAMTSGMIPASAKPSQISPRVGGGFSLFGGYITGLQVDLLRDQRIVQAWRAGSWHPGDYSIASFLLTDEGSATRLVFDHRGFPAGEADHLAAGWHVNYWEPLAKALAQTGH
jgi:activator of HSP90 ATPase